MSYSSENDLKLKLQLKWIIITFLCSKCINHISLWHCSHSSALQVIFWTTQLAGKTLKLTPHFLQHIYKLLRIWCTTQTWPRIRNTFLITLIWRSVITPVRQTFVRPLMLVSAAAIIMLLFLDSGTFIKFYQQVREMTQTPLSCQLPLYMQLMRTEV